MAAVRAGSVGSVGGVHGGDETLGGDTFVGGTKAAAKKRVRLVWVISGWGCRAEEFTPELDMEGVWSVN